jgi:hypothetical protein
VDADRRELARPDRCVGVPGVWVVADAEQRHGDSRAAAATDAGGQRCRGGLHAVVRQHRPVRGVAEGEAVAELGPTGIRELRNPDEPEDEDGVWHRIT